MLQSIRDGDRLIVRIGGELDHFCAQSVRRDLDALLLDRSIRTLILDFSSLTFMDSSGIGVVLGRYRLLRGADRRKDQSYVLYNLTQQQLAHVRLPLGALHKTEVRAIAEQHHFINARKHDSQDICFVPDGDYARFMEGFTGKHYPAGDFLDESGKVVGTHNGAVRYTLGQRKGLGLALGAPVYVCGKDMQANTVTVGPESALFDRIVYAEDVNWIAIPELKEPLRVTARTRYHQPERPATATLLPDGRVRVDFAAPQRAIAPGQAVVLYNGESVIGGGTILNVE